MDKNIYNKIINESNEIAYKLDNDEIVDKMYNKIMIYFKENFTNIIKYMDKIKEDKFYLVDDALKDGLFNLNEKQHMKSELDYYGIKIINEIKNMNEKYSNLLRENISKFINENLENLNDIIIDFKVLLSEVSLKELSILYEVGFNSSLNKIKNDILKNKLLIKEYYTNYIDIIEGKISLFDQSEYEPLKTKKKITQGYLRKYNIYKNHIEHIKNYIKKQLYNDLIEEYKNIISKLKANLEIFKNNKISEIYKGISQFNFNNKHINDINDINNKINLFFSLDIFNSNYLPFLNDFKAKEIEEIENITYYIESQHDMLKELEISEDDSDIDNDMCEIFTIEMILLGESIIFDTDESCSKIKSCYDIYKKLIDISIDSDENIQLLSIKFNNLLSLINEKTNNYNLKINIIKNSLLYLENETFSKNTITNILSSFKDKIDFILSEKFGEKIIKNSYNYYKKNIEFNINSIFNDINKKWNESFELLIQEIKSNLTKFKNSFQGLKNMAKIIKIMISNEIMKKYFDSIINLQRAEFNNTISFYFNYLFKIVNSTHLYIINNIPNNEMIANAYLDIWKNEINDELNTIIQKIIDSKNEVFKINNQINILQVEESNFFELNFILNNEITNISQILEDKIEIIANIDNNKSNDEYSITSNLYLENSENGKQNNKFYEIIFDNSFIELNQVTFKQLLLENWIFDEDLIINQINISLYKSNKEISNDFLIVKQNYTLMLENQINDYFTKKSLIENINSLYKNEIKELDIDQIKEIKDNVNETLQRIKEHLFNESQRMKNSDISYSNNFSQINNTIKEFKENIFEEIKAIFFDIIREFKENMINKIYKEYIEKGLNEYIIESKKYTKNLKEYKLLNSTFNLGNIIDKIIEDLVNEYKELSKKQIDYQYQIRLKDIFKFEELKLFINEEIDSEYNSKLLPVLKEKAIDNPGISDYTEYDLNNNIKDDINSILKKNINIITNIALSIKGSNYQVDIIDGTINWKTLDFSKINVNIKDIENYFEEFIDSEKVYEKNYINECLKNIIKLNFNNLTNNIISTFGIDFFERQLKYNKLFRILNLYDNLGYSISQTMSYYLDLNLEGINNLPK